MNSYHTITLLELLFLSIIGTCLSFNNGSVCGDHPFCRQEISTAGQLITVDNNAQNGVNNMTNGIGTSRTSSQSPGTVPFPAMPAKIRAILHEDWDILDPKGSNMVRTMSTIDGAVEFAHASTTFYEHLKGTFSILAAWDQPEEVRRTGLVHTAYSGDLFMFYLFDSNSEVERQELRDILGEKAEALTYLFGTVDRGSLFNFKNAQNDDIEVKWTGNSNGTQTVMHRGSAAATIDVTIHEAAALLMVTIADYLDQMVETNGWKDHHQIEDGGSNLYPGNGMPALGFYWFSSVCNGIKDYLDVVPSVFNHCETVISYDNDVEARDTYWKVVMEEQRLTEEEQINLLKKTVHLNPFVGEPHMMLSQIYYRQQKFYKAAMEARAGLEKFYSLASCWDKRRSYGHWVGFSRSLLLRANRMLERQETSFPCKDANSTVYVNHNNLALANLNDVVKEMRDREESHNLSW